MASIKNLTIKLQTGTDNTYYASWSFNATTTTSSTIKKGSLVKIKSSTTKWHNGTAISDWVYDYKWYVIQSDSDGRIVLGPNEDGTHDIQSAIASSKVTLASGGTSSVSSSSLDHYEVEWFYDSGDNKWFRAGSAENTNETYAFYSPPENALRFKVRVTPVSKTYKEKVGDTEVNRSYWTGRAVSLTYSLANVLAIPEVPETPTSSIENYYATLSVAVTDPKADFIQFELSTATKIGVSRHTAEVRAALASCRAFLTPGQVYRVRCRACHKISTGIVYSEYGDFVDIGSSVPNSPTSAPVCVATSSTSIRLSWDYTNAATAYDIEYATNRTYFDATDQTTKVEDIELRYRELTGLETGQTYFFRYRAKNDTGTTGWSHISSVTIGEPPTAPTTWSSTSTAVIGTDVILYWMHNSRDNSSQTYAQIELYVNGELTVLPVINTSEEDDDEKTNSYTLSTKNYTEDTVLQWRVRTAGVTEEFGAWSVQRKIEINANPTLEMGLINSDGDYLYTLTQFPFYFKATAGPASQKPLSYHITIISNDMYETVDEMGNPKVVSSGDEIYSSHFDTSDVLMIEFLPNKLTLVNNKNYTLICSVAMDSGLNVEGPLDFDVSWTDIEVEPRLNIDVDRDTYYAFLHPYCMPAGAEEGSYELMSGVTLAVYRREYDGTFTEIATGLDNSRYTTVVDPHPSLDYARYRIVATVNETGAISYYDPPSTYVGGKCIVVQWDERWSNYDSVLDETMEEKPWSGSMIKLPYDISVTNSYSKDVELIEYVGRTVPVAYYGTHLGETGSWTTSIPKEDREMIYALRRLSKWMGNVYVREPSGVGYWASASVSFNENYNDPKVPITLDVTRVEGGM